MFNQDWLNQLNKQMEQLQQQMQEMEKLRAAMAAMPTVNIIHSAAKAAQAARPARPASASINQMAAAMMNQEQLDQLAAQADPDESEDLLTSILPHLSQGQSGQPLRPRQQRRIAGGDTALPVQRRAEPVG